MTTVASPHVSSLDHLAQEQHMQRALRPIDGHGWRERLAPLAQHMGNRRLVRARSDRGTALALLDLDTLHEALMHLQRHDPSQAPSTPGRSRAARCSHVALQGAVQHGCAAAPVWPSPTGRP